MIRPATKILYRTDIAVYGREPFLSFGDAALILNLHTRYGASHNLVHTSNGAISFHSVGQGDVIRVQISKEHNVDVPWYQSIKDFWKKVWK